MTNQIALILCLTVLGIFVADALFFDWGLPVIVGKGMVSMVEYLSFWR